MTKQTGFENTSDWGPGSPQEVIRCFQQYLPKATTGELLEAIANFRAQLRSIDRATNPFVSYTDDKKEIRRELLNELLRLAQLEAERRKLKVDVSAKRARSSLRELLAKSNPDIVKRLSIVAKYIDKSDLVICKRFDLEGVPVVEKWGKEDWKEAYRDPSTKPKVESLISKHRRKARDK